MIVKENVEIRRRVSLREFTTFRIGGEASYLFVAHSTDGLQEFIRDSFVKGKDFHFLGGGSNLLISDATINKPVVTLGEEFSFIKRLDECIVCVGSRTPLSKLIAYAISCNLKGLEELSGIPATVGGMAAMNASSFGKSFCSLIEEATVITENGEIKNIKSSEIKFGYRFSSLRSKIVIEVKLKLEKDRKVKDRVGFYMKKRMASQEFSFPSAGCIFKNPSGVSAARLIDMCALNGFMVGDAQISLRHANFIINRGKARAKDVVYLIELVKERVCEKFGIELEEEVIRWEC